MTGETAHWNSPKLTAREWEQIRERYQAGETAATLALEFGVRRQTIAARVPRRT